jgi:hypothetical protein
MAAAGAPPLIAVSTAHGSACWTGVVDAIAAVELIIKEPATNAPTNPFNPKLAISFLRPVEWARTMAKPPAYRKVSTCHSGG